MGLITMAWAEIFLKFIRWNYNLKDGLKWGLSNQNKLLILYIDFQPEIEKIYFSFSRI